MTGANKKLRGTGWCHVSRRRRRAAFASAERCSFDLGFPFKAAAILALCSALKGFPPNTFLFWDAIAALRSGDGLLMRFLAAKSGRFLPFMGFPSRAIRSLVETDNLSRVAALTTRPAGLYATSWMLKSDFVSMMVCSHSWRAERSGGHLLASRNENAEAPYLFQAFCKCRLGCWFLFKSYLCSLQRFFTLTDDPTYHFPFGLQTIR